MEYPQRIQRAVDFIENNLTEKITIQDVAKQACFSVFHFHRIFQAMLGESIGEYIRKRRLTRAGLELIDSNRRILDIAVEYQFESQEAFTRSFKKHFGMTPGGYRKKQKNLTLFQKPKLSVDDLMFRLVGISLQPNIVFKPEMKIIGMECSTTLKDNRIPQLWQDFIPRMDEIRSRKEPGISYGICRADPDFDVKEFSDVTQYTEIVGVGVEDFQTIPEGMHSHLVPAQKYAVFTHTGFGSNLTLTYNYIYATWLPKSGCEIAGADDFELYDQSRFFGIDCPESKIDIYIPIV